MPLPTFLIVGAKKCGTTTLAEAIAAHPQGFVPPSKEVHFFDLDAHWRRGVGWYERAFEGAGDAVAIGEATPEYMAGPQAIERMAQVLPDAQLVVCVRNPVDRAYAHYLHAFQRDAHESRSFERAVRDELEGTVPRGRLRYLAPGRYAEQIDALERRYPRERVHVVLLDDLETDPAATLAGVCRHLGVEPLDLAVRKANAHIEFHPVWLWRLLKRRDMIGRLPKRPTEWLVERTMMRADQPYEPLAGPLRERLAEHFAPSNERLGARLGRDLSHWR